MPTELAARGWARVALRELAQATQTQELAQARHQDTEPGEQRVIIQCLERVIGDHNLSITCVFEALGSFFHVDTVRCRAMQCSWRTAAFSRENRLDRRSGAPKVLSERARRRLKASSEKRLKC